MATTNFVKGTKVTKEWLNDADALVYDVWNAKSAAGTSGTIITSDGTNLVNTTATYPSTTTVSQILYSSAANTVTGLATANSAVLVTNGSGVPSLGTTLPTGLTATGWASLEAGDDTFRIVGSADATKKLAFEVDGLTTATTRTLTVQDEDGTVALTSEFTYSNVAGSNGRMPLPRMWISGLTYSRDTDTDHDTAIAAGECRDEDNTDNMILSATLTKQIDAVWAVGDDAGGLDTGSVTTSTWYFLWLIKRTDTGVVDALYSTSSSSPTMPTNYDKKRLIGAVKTDGSSNILAYTTVETSGGGINALWTDPPLDVDVSEDATANTRTLGGVPTGVKLFAEINVISSRAGGNTAGVYLSSLDQTDEAASTSAAPLMSSFGTSDGSVQGAGNGTWMRVRTNTSAQIRSVAADASTTLRISTLGWEWSRR